jgi:D-alanine--poly(phosphoribitol) ligase subunit 1
VVLNPGGSLRGSRTRRDSVLGLVLDRSLEQPRAPAMKDDRESLDYGQLVQRVQTSAAGLSALGVAPGDRVVLLLPNSVSFLVVALACLWTGATFVPLPVADPPGRIAGIVSDCAADLVVSSEGPEVLGVEPTLSPRYRTIDAEQLFSHGGTPPPVADDLERDSYMIYTSGTTGAPKGVRISGGAFSAAVTAIAGAMGFDQTTRALCVSSFNFDGPYGIAFPALAAGGSLVIPKVEELLLLKRFFRVVREEQVTHTGFPPSYLRLVLSSSHMRTLVDSRLTTVGLGGDECMALDVARLWEVLPDLRVFNRYGPTETTIEVTTYEVSRRDVAAGRIPIGLPHNGVSFYLVAEDGGVIGTSRRTGELYVGGSQLMTGYWHDDALTETVFRTDVVPGEILYKTGDLAWRDDEGRYFYAGRTDDVVKPHGVRISLREVAQALRAVGSVRAATCLLTDQDGRSAVTAYVEGPPDLKAEDLLEAVRATLPATMLPDEIFVLPSLPTTASGKVDQESLLRAASRHRAPLS